MLLFHLKPDHCRQIVTERITISSQTIPYSPTSSSNTSSPCPSYSITVSYLRSTSGGKSLLAKGKTSRTRPYNEFFEESGTLDLDVFESWVGKAVEDVMDDEAR
jgi:signal peptidase complex subunit 2